MQYIRNLINDHHGNFIRFAIVGISNTIINLSIFSALYYIYDFTAITAHLLSFAGATINSFIFNKFWAFKDTRQTDIHKQFFKFITVTGSALIISTGILWLLDQYIWTIIAKLITIGFTMCWNYCGMHFLIFNAKDTEQETS